jgi:nitrate reductase assembly molybdenum cofactor insertion protein NarJ
MDTENTTQNATANITTPAPAFILASLLSSYPDANFTQNIGLLLSDDELREAGERVLDNEWLSLEQNLVELISAESNVDAVRSEYIELFDRGRSTNSLYETEYGRARAAVKGNELVDIAGFYRAFGLNLDSDETQREMLDHIGVELEFYGLLLLKQNALAELNDVEGQEIVLDARKKFLLSHLGAFAPALLSRPGIVESSHYSKVFNYCCRLVADECELLDVKPEPISWTGLSEKESADVSCGGSAGCVS